jgi:DNA polymerase III subunit epsilon
LAQLEHYPTLPRDIQGLHDLCNTMDPTCVDAEGKLVWRDGEAFFNFGKYKCKSLAEVVKNDPGYLDWIQQTDFSRDLKDICLKAKKGVFPRNAPALKAS